MTPPPRRDSIDRQRPPVRMPARSTACEGREAWAKGGQPPVLNLTGALRAGSASFRSPALIRSDPPPQAARTPRGRAGAGRGGTPPAIATPHHLQEERRSPGRRANLRFRVDSPRHDDHPRPPMATTAPPLSAVPAAWGGDDGGSRVGGGMARFRVEPRRGGRDCGRAAAGAEAGGAGRRLSFLLGEAQFRHDMAKSQSWITSGGDARSRRCTRRRAGSQGSV